MADIDEQKLESKRGSAGRKARAPRREDADFPDTPDPIEIAMAAVATGADRHEAARAVLEKHACLIDVQCAREKEELGVLRVQRLTRWLILAAGLALLAGVAALIWNASRSTSLVIEPFGVPPALAQRGLTGKVVSARVLDELAELQRRTESMRGEKSYANDWQGDIQLDIPQTGISIGEAWRTLKGWLGEETRIGGEVVQLPTGLAMTTRAGALSGGTVQGPEAEFDRLVREAAAGIYKVTQPYRYAISLPPERLAETEQVLIGLTGDASDMERKWAYSGLSRMARARGDDRRAIAMAGQALAIDPNLLPAIGNLTLALGNLGHDEAMLASAERVRAAFGKAHSGEYDERVVALNRTMTDAMAAERLGDADGMMRQVREMEQWGASSFRSLAIVFGSRAAMIARDHPRAQALAQRYASSADSETQSEGASLQIRARLERALDHGDKAAAEAAAKALVPAVEAALARTGEPGLRAPWLGTYAMPQAAIAYGRLGNSAKAAALAERLAKDCYDCARARGWAAAAAGDRRGAERWFREAIRQGPSIPMAYSELGEMLLRAGDLTGAAQRFEEASRRGPGWADPLKLWGDSLVRQDRHQEAVQKYVAAAERAPRWGLLHIELAKAQWRIGRRDDARATLKAAARMDLGVRDRTRLRRLWQVAKSAG
jgi:tetratricopeptide (TPR) repeat protein